MSRTSGGSTESGQTEAGSVASSHGLGATVVITTATTAKASLPAGLMRSACRDPALRGPPSFQHCALLPPHGQNEGPGCLAAERPSCGPLTAAPALPCPVWAEAVRAEVSLRGGGLSQT